MWYNLLAKSISTSNHMFGRVIWDKLPKCIFEHFEVAQGKPGQFQIFQKLWGWFIPKIALTKRDHTKPKNTLYWNWYLLTVGNYKSVSRQLENSWQLQNNTIKYLK